MGAGGTYCSTLVEGGRSTWGQSTSSWFPPGSRDAGGGVGRAATVDQPGRRRRGAGDRRRVFPRAPAHEAAFSPRERSRRMGARVGAATSRDSAQAVIDIARDPLALAENAGAADLVSGGRLQVGIRNSWPEQVVERGAGASAARPGRSRNGRGHGPGRAQVLLEVPWVTRALSRRAQSPPPMFPRPARPGGRRAALGRAAGARLVRRHVTADRPGLSSRAGPESAEFDADR